MHSVTTKKTIVAFTVLVIAVGVIFFVGFGDFTGKPIIFKKGLVVVENRNNTEPVEAETLTEEVTSQLSDVVLYQTFLADENDQETYDYTIDYMLSSIKDSIQLEVIPSRIYTEKDLLPTVGNSVEELAKYGNSLVFVIKKYGVQITEDELYIVAEAMELQSKTSLERLDPIIAVYKNVLNDLLLTEVPELLLDEHILLLNSIQKIADYLEDTKYILDDPVRGLVGTQGYTVEWDKLRMNLDAINSLLIEQGVNLDINSKTYTIIIN